MVAHTRLLQVAPAKAPTGIEGLDAATHGGFPRGRTTLVEGGPGAGKTLLALQSLVYAARDLDEPGIFVAFEETSSRVIGNATRFGWDFQKLQKKKLFFLDAQPNPDMVQSGSFDLTGMLAVLDAKIAQMGARRITFDAIDVVLAMLEDAAAERRELYRLHDWLRARELTAVITSKAGPAGAGRQPSGFMQFMVDCAVTLDHRVVQGVSQRSLRVVKFRGADFYENEAPYVIGSTGLDVACASSDGQARRPVTKERLSTGIARLDTMLGGGVFRGASILVTGVPGTAKTTLSGAFAAAACERGESTLFVTFDSDTGEVARNLSSVGLRLDKHMGSARQPGLLHMTYARALAGSAETHLLQIRALAREHKVRCVIVDPISALSKSGNQATVHSVAERLVDWSKTEGITLFCTSLLDDDSLSVEGSPLQISTIADTWVHLSYLVRGGERNRSLSIIKSRGTAHSNQVRELVLANTGVTLADTYMSGGEVLMGTMRWERELAEENTRREAEYAQQHAHLSMVAEEADLASQLTVLQRQLSAKRADLALLDRTGASRRDGIVRSRSERQALRGVDAVLEQPVKRAAR